MINEFSCRESNRHLRHLSAIVLEHVIHFPHRRKNFIKDQLQTSLDKLSVLPLQKQKNQTKLCISCSTYAWWRIQKWIRCKYRVQENGIWASMVTTYLNGSYAFTSMQLYALQTPFRAFFHWDACRIRTRNSCIESARLTIASRHQYATAPVFCKKTFMICLAPLT